jgi:hypothetical protein
MKSISNISPDSFTFERYPLGGYILWLRENFHEVTEIDEQGETYTSWVYDEYTMLTPTFLSDEFIEQHFDEYLTEAKRIEATKTDKRLLSLESAVDDLANLIGGIIR